MTEAERSALYTALDQNTVWLLHNYNGAGQPLSAAPNGLATGQNSGYQAINLAVLAGVKRILLVGYDMKPGPSGEVHWFGDHPIKTDVAFFSSMLQHFPKLARRLIELDIEVWNCNPDSAISVFPKVPLDEALARLQHDSRPAALPA